MRYEALDDLQTELRGFGFRSRVDVSLVCSIAPRNERAEAEFKNWASGR